MLPFHYYKKRRRSCKRYIFYGIIVLAFLLTWATLTLIILYLQDTLLPESDPTPAKSRRDTLTGGLQVVVGHYNGNLKEEKLRNLTDDELNANNYNPIEGWGEGGTPVELSESEKSIADNLFSINQFNIYVSDRISIERSLPDMRRTICRDIKYPETSSLPTTSVIIVYHNEAFSTLLRTVMSVVNRSPKQLIKEIILVDDFSNRTFLKSPTLDNALKNLPIHVMILRAKERVGLIRARLMGAQEATGEVLTFLDSHCECTDGWLEPLLARIKEDRKAVVCPVIDVINDRTFQYQKGIDSFRGGFNWNLQFRWYSMPAAMAKDRQKNMSAPIASPTMAGGLFSIDRKYFEELGEYDSEMTIWGGENLEISFRIWQCGGRIEILPCSHVGHIFRHASPHDYPGKKFGDTLSSNLMRVAEVWMDEWKYLFYKITPQAERLRHTLDTSDRKELRKKLLCKDFKWYLDNVFIDHFMPTDKDFFGRILNSQTQRRHCLAWGLSDLGIKKARIDECKEKAEKFSRTEISTSGYCIVGKPGEASRKNHRLSGAKCSLGFDIWQIWLYTADRRIRSDEHLCLSARDATQMIGNWEVQLKECAGTKAEYWTYSMRKKRFVHDESGLCLTLPRILDSKKDDLMPPELQKCGEFEEDQQWSMKPIAWLPDNEHH